MTPNILILGAGVSGLTTALLLARDGGYNITIIAKHMPGDYDIDYASPWAGADFSPPRPSLGNNPDDTRKPFEIDTWPELEKLARYNPESGIHFQDSFVYLRAQDANTPAGSSFAELIKKDGWFRNTVPNFRFLPQSDHPAGMGNVATFISVCINTALYLPWLASQCLKHGVVIHRGIVSHVVEAAELHHVGKADLVVNCTGLSSLQLGGVEDSSLYPTRGQIAIVRNDPGIIASMSSTDDGLDESAYVMNRAAGGGCVLGGCAQNNNWDSQPDPNLAVRIMKRCVDLCPQLIPNGKGIEGLSVVRHAVGLRPARKGGIRIEAETKMSPAGDKSVVVHNYGHGGYGYQTSYGCAKATVQLVNEALRSQAIL